ncbi:hypothetical protein H113_08270 [Trichophyton rubrum MR1459]|uniref:Uncharacterized protein n=1 Tax=Trichophyton rubrum (strain ATCC MYA-4607 / CBS 118892) TaxID=559305 RepID=A0A080WE09_TRIRC|nr:uncharacterized protein TERG_11625 [Trichophyton rubrum CBS 118892]EZF90625.1 hypothetical protein H113_08270 [Trichophyton rubrum MR1459]EZG01675.1 hypothetical protein H106_08077 [Trichophyton rubrum CBS 735.88]KFL60376.1 hypothetical protein TERG_11625 [Trichophyton rubrum CBS 118892]
MCQRAGWLGQFPGLTHRGAAWLLRQDGLPSGEAVTDHLLLACGRCRVGGGQIRCLDEDMLAVVADEVCGIDLDSLDDPTAYTELDECPVVLGGVMASGLPSVVPGPCVDEDAWPVDRGAGGEQVRCGGEVLVATGQDSRVQGR